MFGSMGWTVLPNFLDNRVVNHLNFLRILQHSGRSDQLSPSSVFAKRIKQIHTEFSKITHVSSCDCQPMNPSCCCNHSILNQRIRLAVLEPRPLPESIGVYSQDAITGDNLDEPSFQLRRLRRILFPGNLDSRLNLTDCDGRQKKLISR